MEHWSQRVLAIGHLLPNSIPNVKDPTILGLPFSEQAVFPTQVNNVGHPFYEED